MFHLHYNVKASALKIKSKVYRVYFLVLSTDLTGSDMLEMEVLSLPLKSLFCFDKTIKELCLINTETAVRKFAEYEMQFLLKRMTVPK